MSISIWCRKWKYCDVKSCVIFILTWIEDKKLTWKMVAETIRELPHNLRVQLTYSIWHISSASLMIFSEIRNNLLAIFKNAVTSVREYDHSQWRVSEIMLIAILYKCSHFNNFKAFFFSLKYHHSQLFRDLPLLPEDGVSHQSTSIGTAYFFCLDERLSDQLFMDRFDYATCMQKSAYSTA